MGGHTDRELASPGVKALVAATYHLCPMLETFGASPPLQGSLDPLKHPYCPSPQKPGTDSCPQAGPLPGAAPRGVFPESVGQ